MESTVPYRTKHTAELPAAAHDVDVQRPRPGAANLALDGAVLPVHDAEEVLVCPSLAPGTMRICRKIMPRSVRGKGAHKQRGRGQQLGLKPGG